MKIIVRSRKLIIIIVLKCLRLQQKLQYRILYSISHLYTSLKNSSYRLVCYVYVL